MSLLPVITIVMVFTIPILAILFAGYKEWLKFKSKHNELGSSTQEARRQFESLRERLDRVEQERDALLDRVQNLETIVTSEAWIAQHDDSVPTIETDASGLDLPSNSSEQSLTEAEQSATLARRLRND